MSLGWCRSVPCLCVLVLWCPLFRCVNPPFIVKTAGSGVRLPDPNPNTYTVVHATLIGLLLSPLNKREVPLTLTLIANPLSTWR